MTADSTQTLSGGGGRSAIRNVGDGRGTVWDTGRMDSGPQRPSEGSKFLAVRSMWCSVGSGGSMAGLPLPPCRVRWCPRLSSNCHRAPSFPPVPADCTIPLPDQVTPVASAVPYLVLDGNHDTGEDSFGECGVPFFKRSHSWIYSLCLPDVVQDCWAGRSLGVCLPLQGLFWRPERSKLSNIHLKQPPKLSNVYSTAAIHADIAFHWGVISVLPRLVSSSPFLISGCTGLLWHGVV